MRYLSSDLSKVLTPRERDGYFASGLSVGLVWENEGTEMDGGYLAGYDHGRKACDSADLLSWPADRPIYFADDNRTATPENIAYVQGARDAAVGRHPVGVYGGGDLINWAHDALAVAWGWWVRTWPHSTPWAQLIQEPNIAPPILGTDANTAVALDWGGWAGGATAGVPPAPFQIIPTYLPTGRMLLEAAYAFINQPYSTAPGRTDPASGWKDCSGLIVAALMVLGILAGGNVSTTIEMWAVNNGGHYISEDEARRTPGALCTIWGLDERGHIAFSTGGDPRGAVFETPSAAGHKAGFSPWGRNVYERYMTIPGIDHLGVGRGGQDMGMLARNHYDRRVWFCRAGVRTDITASGAGALDVMAQLAQGGEVPNPVDVRLVGPEVLRQYKEQALADISPVPPGMSAPD